MAQPTDPVTFLFTDIEGSTRLWEERPEAMRSALPRHDALLNAAIERHGGHVFKTIGDAFCSAFPSAAEALRAAIESQRRLLAEDWSEVGSLRVRMALHTGAAEPRNGDYFGPTLNRISRLLAIGHGRQVLLSEATALLVQAELPDGVALRYMGNHQLKDLQQPEHVRQLIHSDLPQDFPPLRSLQNYANNLPGQSTSFIGRERELEEVRRLLLNERLLTLVGVGGTGKSRLALQVAAETLDNYADGVWLIELAPLSDAALVPQSAAEALKIREESGRPLIDTLTAYLAQKQVLLLLDNCEHLLPACVYLVNALLKQCPGARILATSREPLGIAGEQVYRVPTLGLPKNLGMPSVESLEQVEAVRLFCDRARHHQPDFHLTGSNAAALAQVCAQLDGIPLAIELAAARVRALAVEQIASRLSDRFRLLTGGSRAALPRQQTLRALMDWSYDLLSQTEKTLLHRLSVFTGGWTLEAAEQVCSGEEVEKWETLDLLTSLVDKSLVLYDGQNGRYRLLETVKQYARERLSAEEEAVLLHSHGAWCLALAEEGEKGMIGPEQERWATLLENEHDNFRAALGRHGALPDDAETGLRLANALSWFWTLRGYHGEGLDWLTKLLKGSAEENSLTRAKALRDAGHFAWRRGDYAAARAFFEEARGRYESLGSTNGLIGAITGLANVAWYTGDYATAEPLYEESLRLARESGDNIALPKTLNNLALAVSRKRDWPQARILFEEALAIRREQGDLAGVANILSNLSNVFLEEGNLERASQTNEESLQILLRLGERLGQSYALEQQARLAKAREDWSAVRAALREGLTLKQEVGEQYGVYNLLGFFAQVEARQQNWIRAVHLWSAAEALRQNIGAGPFYADEEPEYERDLAEARAALGDTAFEKAWSAGQAMTTEDAIHYARQQE